MDRPISMLILLVVGIAFSLVIASIAYGFMLPWGQSGKLFIESVDILWTPSGSSITINVRNVGGVMLSSCTARMLNPLTSIDDVVPSSIPPGRSATFFESNVPGLTAPNTYVFEVTCLTPQGTQVIDKKSAQPHL
jgi:hypothetical protein